MSRRIPTFLSSRRSPHIRLPRAWQRHPWLVLLAAILCVLAILDHRAYRGWQGDDQARYHDQVFRCVRVIDGDTIDVDMTDGRYAATRIRLRGVDTPEVEHPGRLAMHFGDEASQFTRQELLHSRVRLELPDGRTRDRYGRLLAYVYSDETGDLFNARLIRSGHGYADRRFKHPRMAEFVEYERQARRGGLGLWKNLSRDQMPAWRQKIDD